LSLIVWGHHMFTTGMNPYVAKYFSIATVLITVPFAVLGFNLIASVWKARLRLNTAALFTLGLISAIGTGGLGGLYLGTAASDIHFHESYFVVGHFHFMIGVVTFFGIYAGIYHWFPKMFGRFLNEGLGKLHFWLTIVPLFAVFILMHYQGMGGMLRRTYDPGYYDFARDSAGLNVTISILAFVGGAAQLLFLVNFVASALKGRPADGNPWKANTLEWTTESPAPHGNWPGETPVVHRWPYEYGRNGHADDYVPQSAGEGEGRG